MRLKNKGFVKYGRSILALLLLCGLLLPIGAGAATVTYQYDRIQDADDLPTDNQWHDYFIAWEDTDDSIDVWFTDYNWYTPSGDNNIDAGGITWMEYVSSSTLPSDSSSFTSDECLGHMQIKYAGRDSDNGNSPKYQIRVSKMTGGYSYFTATEPTGKASDADAFTFEKMGNGIFNIFVNMGGADRYLTRDGRQLETTLSSSVGAWDTYCELRVYRRTAIIEEQQDQGSIDIEGNESTVEGKVTMYEYNWVNTVEELNALVGDADGDWHQYEEVFLAWEDCDKDNGKKNNPDKVWYTKEVWYDNEKPNYENDDFGLDHEFYYWSNDWLGSDGYGSAYADSFVMAENVGHFEMKFVGWDGDNHVDGARDANGEKIKCPKFNIRFAITPGNYAYIGNDLFVTDSDDAVDFTVQLRLNESKKNNSDYYYGSAYFFRNKTILDDEYITRKGNRFDLSAHNFSDNWEFPFRIYTRKAEQYDAIVRSFTISAGGTYAIDKHLILNEGVTITVEEGGVLMVDQQLYNNGHILVKKGGTVIVNEGAYIMPYGKVSQGSITLDGGDLVILDGGKVLCDEAVGELKLLNGATVSNRGLLVVNQKLELRNNSQLYNAATGELLVGGRIGQDRGGVGSLSEEKLRSIMTNVDFTCLCSVRSKIINEGAIYTPRNKDVYWQQDGSSSIRDVNGGQTLSR